MHVLLLRLLYTHPTGSPVCVSGPAELARNGFGGVPRDPPATLDVFCENGGCLLTSDVSFKGVLIHASDGALSSASPAMVARTASCLTHKARLSDTRSVSFNVSKSSSINVVVVFKNSGGIHEYQHHSAVATVLEPRNMVYIVGGGAGGVAAARYLGERNQPYTLFERGPPLPDNFYELQIAMTAANGPLFAFGQLNSIQDHSYNTDAGNIELWAMLGGLQNVNGAVFAPGALDELSLSLNAPLNATTAALSLVRSWIAPQESMMWRCIDSTAGCDEKTFSTFNVKQKRRSVATGASLSIVNVNTEVKKVNDSGIELSNGSIIELGDDDRVIVAAGALTTPVLLGKTTFTAWNHYYFWSLIQGEFPYERQTFEYDGEYEYNYGQVQSPLGNESGSWMNITMHMYPTYRELYTVGEQFPGATLRGADCGHPDPEGQCLNAWHYAGTVEHNELQVSPKILVGDASALSTPFNCHTSVPANVAGVLAAQKALNMLPADPDPVTAVRTKVGVPVAFAFILGSFLLLLGILSHVLDQRWLHYIFMPLATIILLSASLSAASNDANYQTKTHATLGWILIVGLVLQVFGGIYLKTSTPYKNKSGIYHRITGSLFLGLLLASTATSFVNYRHWKLGDAIRGFAIFILAFTTGLLFAVIIKLRARIRG